MTVASYVSAPPRLAYSIQEVCEMLGFSESFFYDEVKRGRIKYLKVTRGMSRVLAKDVQAYLDALPVGTSAESQ